MSRTVKQVPSCKRRSTLSSSEAPDNARREIETELNRFVVEAFSRALRTFVSRKDRVHLLFVEGSNAEMLQKRPNCLNDEKRQTKPQRAVSSRHRILNR